jgi:hypothetical protein
LTEKLPKNLLEQLSPNEEIIGVLKTVTLASKPDYTVLTNHRILYFNEKHLGRYDMKNIPYSKLSGVKAERGRLMYGSIEIIDESNESVKLEKVPKDQIEPFIDKLETAINNVAIEPVSINRQKRLLGKMLWVFDKPPEMVFRSVPTNQPVSRTDLPPPPPDDHVKRMCKTCHNKLSYIKEYDRWYCYQCKEYQ